MLSLMENSKLCVLDKQVNNLHSVHYNMETQSVANGTGNIAPLLGSYCYSVERRHIYTCVLVAGSEGVKKYHTSTNSRIYQIKLLHAH